MEALLAGWIAGYAVSISSTVVLTYLAMREGGRVMAARLVAREVPGPLLAVLISIGNTLIWTAAGLVLGAAYGMGDFGEAAGGLGSPSLGFTATMLTLAVAPLILLSVLWRRDWWVWLLACVPFAAAFGWLLPHLAAR